jgi:hypothetical protein
VRNLRPEQFDSRASKASDADSPQRLRACVEAVSHRQRRSTNPPRLKSSAGKGKPGQHTNNRTVTHRPSNRLISGWLPNETTAPTPCNSRKLHPTGATCAQPPTNTVPKKHNPKNKKYFPTKTPTPHKNTPHTPTTEPNPPKHR